MSSVSATQSEVASGAVLLLGSCVGAVGTTHLGFAAAVAPVGQIVKNFASAGIPLLATFTTANVVYPCFSTAQLAKMVLLYADATAAGADIPALTQCADGAPATSLCACALATAATQYRVLLLA
jgi:hypothetical protein